MAIVYKNGIIRKTLSELFGFIQNELAMEYYAKKNGFLQLLNPVVKLLFIILMIGITSVIRSFLSVALVLVIIIFLIHLSQFELKSYAKRVWMILPLLAFIISLPAATNLIIPGSPLLFIIPEYYSDLFPAGVFVTHEGLQKITILCLRMGLSISWGYLLIMSTRWSEITFALRTLKVPAMIVSIMDMTYRYIFLLVRTASEMFEARQIRTVGKLSNKNNRRFIFRSIAVLFIKSTRISEDVYTSMLCRGYTGEVRALKKYSIDKRDIIILFILILMAFSVGILDMILVGR